MEKNTEAVTDATKEVGLQAYTDKTNYEGGSFRKMWAP
jgi:hypothetical protein